ncbi:MAG: hypothetical protein HKP48_03800 [Winogradskyella sp.]|uniref:hypothetical protein n=1 Tax=Winogradskyella sp. TaxID=1883156 RepID=UPI001831E0FC|nr:hypothetical protein [Winogradskyella sp.]NNK22426.1 hypothetical protein [Winogradskyella sp.]
MSKLFGLLLSSLILIQSLHIGTDDIMQLDELIKHAQFHKQEHGDNFFVFLSKHYGELKAEHSKNHQEEQNEHEQLPFKYHGHNISILAFFNITLRESTDQIYIIVRTEGNFHYLNLYASLHETQLLQPPKYA